MKHKDNARINPFEHMLYPDEDILWLYAPTVITPQDHLERSLSLLRPNKRFLLLMGVGALCILLVVGITQPNAFQVFMQIMGFLLGTALFLVGIVYIVAWLQRDRNPSYRYALTSQRLMFATETIPEWFNVSDIKSLYIRGDNEQADMTFMLGSAETYTWKSMGECDVVPHLIQQRREMPVKVTRL